jgi:protein SCO1/2
MKRWLTAITLCIGLLYSARAQKLGANIYDYVGIDQRLNETIPLDLRFNDESGRSVLLSDYFRDKPVVLSLVYYQCPMLCPEVLNGMAQGFRSISFRVGQEFNVVTVSINPRETPELAAEKKEDCIRLYGHPDGAAGWHFLTGDEPSINKLAQAVGFHYVYDSTSGQYAHATGIMVLTPEGKLARYFYGIQYEPKDLRFALEEASKNTIGSPVDQLLLLCYHYDPTTGKYGLVVANVLRAGGAVTLLILGGFIGLMLWRERRRKIRMANS